MTVGLAKFVEPVLHRTFGNAGAFVSRRPYAVVATVTVFLVALCFGFIIYEAEHNIPDLLIARRGRISGEKDFYFDNFELISPVLNSVIATPKEGVDILSVEALDEFRDLQESIRTFTFEYKDRLNVSLEQFCFKTINRDPEEPCFQSSILESFREGSVFNVGGELNTDYAILYAARPSYRDFDFENDFSRSFIARTNIFSPDSLLLGSFEVDETDQDTITSVQALQLAFGAKSPKVLMEDGLQYFAWTERVVEDSGNGEFCPDVSRCEACADSLNPAQFAAAGCTFDGSPNQSDQCCAVLEGVRNSPCIEVVYERRPEVGPVANPLFVACGLTIVEVAPRCRNEALFVAADPDAAPAVCVCLAGASDECTAEAGAFLAENPEYTAAFAAAADGDEEAVAELGRVLVAEIGCPLPTAEEEEDPICSCLVDVTSETCTTAVGAFLAENPDQGELFTAAATGDEEAVALVAAFLVEEFGCTIPETPAAPAPAEAVVAQGAPVAYDAEVTIIREETDTIDKAKDVVHAWEKAWRKHMKRVQQKKYQYIELAWLTSTSLDDEVKDAGEAEVHLIIIGYILVFFYLALYCTFDWKMTGVRFSHFPPGPGMSALCFFMVLLSVATALGIAGFMSAVSSFKISFITVNMVPLLMLGLGVNDFFVLVSALKSVLLSPTCPKTVDGVMYETMAVGGTSITLSSATNACAFCLATLSPVPIVLWFTVQMAVGVAIAYIVSITAIPGLLSIAVARHLEGKPDFVLSWLGASSVPEIEKVADDSQGANEGAVATFVRQFRWPITVAVFAVLGVWLGFGIHGIIHFEQGVKLHKAVATDSHPYDYLIRSERHFDVVQINIVFRDEQDYSDPAIFQSARTSEFEYIDEGYRTEKQLMTQSWLEFFSQYVTSKFCSNEICMNEVEWYYDGFSSREFGHATRNICAQAESPEECRTICQTHCPQGPVDSEFRCQYVEDSTECYCPYRPMLRPEYFYENPDGFDSKIVSYWADFLANTTTGLASRVFINFDEATATERNPFGRPLGTRAYAFARGLADVPHQLDHIERGRDILDRQVIDVYPFDILVYAQGEQYIDLAVRTVKAVGITMAVATVVMMPLIAHWFAAVIVSLCVLVGVVLTAATSSWTELNMDYAAYVAFIVTVGLAVEFCAHIGRDFMLTPGDRLTRVLHSLRTMGVAVMNGGVTTFLGILPGALSQLPSIRDRLFVQYSIVVLSGMFVGVILLPTLLSLVGPPAFTDPDASSQPKHTSTHNDGKDRPAEP